MGKKTELYFRIDYNGNGRERGRYGANMPFTEDLIKCILKEQQDYPDPGIAIYTSNNTLCDKIYWRENPTKIFCYFPNLSYSFD